MARIEIGTIDDPEATIYIDGSDELVFEDDSETARFAVSQGGPVRIENSDLRLATGQGIEDGDGASRVRFASNETAIDNPDGDAQISAVNGGLIFRSYSGQDITFRDQNGGFDAVQYITSSSSSVPGTLELTNANLLHPKDKNQGNRKPGLDFITDSGGDGATELYTGEGGVTFDKRSSSPGNNPLGAGSNRAAIYCEGGELVGEDQKGNITTLT